jgi:hypothetical protein
METLELMEPGVFEGQAGAVEEIHDRRRDQDLAGPRHRHDAGRRVDRDSPDVTRDGLDLSGVNAGPDRETQVLDGVADGSRAPNCALGPVELGEHAVAGGLDESSPMAIDRRRGLAVVLSDEVTPARSAKLVGAAGRIDDVGEARPRRSDRAESSSRRLLH